jgi:hypothetical protein
MAVFAAVSVSFANCWARLSSATPILPAVVALMAKPSRHPDGHY